MKRLFAVAAVAAFFVFGAGAQTQPERRVIEVSGSAEQWVTPDTFTFRITVVERLEKKDKITIEQQETLLRDELERIGIDAAKTLTVYDVSSQYIPRKRVRDVLGRKDYRLKLMDITKIGPLVELIDRLSLESTEHSQITRLREETKIEAIKAAKRKAEYLLGAIGERPGKTLFVKEVDDESPRLRLEGVNSNSNFAVSNITRSAPAADDDTDLSFSQIRLRYVIDAKFEIE